MNRRRSKKTADDVIAHFQKRCLERLGIILNQRELKRLMAERQLVPMRKQSNSKTLFRLHKERYNGKQLLQTDIVLAYDKIRHAFVTVMPYDSWKENHDSDGHNTTVYSFLENDII